MRYSIIFLFIFNSIFAQTVLDSVYEDPSEAIHTKRELAIYFSEYLQKIGDASVASIKGGDFNKNGNVDWQKKSFILNTTIQPIVSLGGKRWHFAGLLHTLHVIPSISVRVLSNDSSQHDHSLPVRTPGFVARFSYYMASLKNWSDSNSVHYYWGMQAFHHSNGQDAYEFNEESGWVNTYNGNFSETFVFEPTVGASKRGKYSTKVKLLKYLRSIQTKGKFAEYYTRLSFEYHPRSLTSPRFLQYHLYGRKRINWQLGIIKLFSGRDIICKNKTCWLAADRNFRNIELRRFVINTSYILDATYNHGPLSNLKQVSLMDFSKRLNVDLTWYERIGSKNDYAIFARIGYYGSDPYNIYFQQSLWLARLGFAFGVFSGSEKIK